MPQTGALEPTLEHQRITTHLVPSSPRAHHDDGFEFINHDELHQNASRYRARSASDTWAVISACSWRAIPQTTETSLSPKTFAASSLCSSRSAASGTVVGRSGPDGAA